MTKNRTVPRTTAKSSHVFLRGFAFTLPEVLLALTLLALAAAVLVQSLVNADMAVESAPPTEVYYDRALLQLSRDIETTYRDQRRTSGSFSRHPLLGEVRWTLRDANLKRNLVQLEIEIEAEDGYTVQTKTLLYMPASTVGTP